MKKNQIKTCFITSGKASFFLSTLLIMFSFNYLYCKDFQSYNSWLNNSLIPMVSNNLEINFKKNLEKNIHLNKKEFIRLNNALDLIKDRDFIFPEKYFNTNRLRKRAKYAQKFKATNGRALDEIENKYGVSKNILLAVWAIESDFGRADLAFSSLKALAYQSYFSNRKEYFYTETVELINSLQGGLVSFSEIKSSPMGALGQPQFMPSSFNRFAVDSDFDGKIDIWNSKQDTLGSIANFLDKNGWVEGLDWGNEITTPSDFPCYLEGPDNMRKTSKWYSNGVRKIKKNSPANFSKNTETSLLFPKGEYGPKFLVTKNFYALKSYNNSDLYALYVGHLSDLIDGKVNKFAASWKNSSPINKKDIFSLQKQLINSGYNVGSFDGLIGHKTRRSLGLWQKTMSKKVTCFPS